jgi:hypothetical protein
LPPDGTASPHHDFPIEVIGQAQHLAVTLSVHPDRDHHRLVNQSTAFV